MRLLLDTHIFLWAVSGSALLKAPSRRLIESAEQVFVSAASIWEIAIKARLGKIDADPLELTGAFDDADEDLLQYVFRGLAMAQDAKHEVVDRPLMPLHQDLERPRVSALIAFHQELVWELFRHLSRNLTLVSTAGGR